MGGQSEKRDCFLDHFGLFIYEAMMVLIRRFLLTDMGNPSLTTLAIALTAVEEVFFRATLTWRDDWLRRVRGKKERSKAELKRQHTVWASFINSAMILEITSIFIASFMYLTFSKHRFVFDFGYAVDGISDAEVLGVITAMFTQLFAEALVDGICVALEHMHGLPITDYFKQMNTPWMYISHICSLLQSIHVCLYAYQTVPTFWCANHQDPCTCPFSLYEQVCATDQDLFCTKGTPKQIKNYCNICNICNICSQDYNVTATSFNASSNAAATTNKSNAIETDTPVITFALVIVVMVVVLSIVALVLASWSRLQWKRVEKRKKVMYKSARRMSMIGRQQKKEIEALQDSLAVFQAATQEELEVANRVLDHDITRMLQYSNMLVKSDDVQLVQVIGRGSFGEILEGIFRDMPVAVKRIVRDKLEDEETISRFQDEICMMFRLRHPKIVHFLAACLTPPNFLIVQELMRMGDLGCLDEWGFA